MDWRERITVDPNVLVGKPVIKGARIAVEFVIDLLGRGWTREEIHKEYDHLTPLDIQACLAYAGEILLALRSAQTQQGSDPRSPERLAWRIEER